MFKFIGHRKTTVSTRLIFMRFFVSLGIAGLETVWAIYLYSFGLSESEVGMYLAILNIVSLSSSFVLAPILHKFHKNILQLFGLSASVLFLLGMYFAKDFTLFFTLAIMLTFFMTLLRSNFNVLFRNNTPSSSLNQAEGLMYALLNSAWLIGPLIAGFVIIQFGAGSVFALAASFFFFAFLYFLVIHVLEPRDSKVTQFNLIFDTFRFIKDKDMHFPYLIVVAIETWWIIPYVYIPLLIVTRGYDVSLVSIFLALLVIPLILLEYRVGKVSQKEGFSRLFKIGFLGLTILSLIAFFTYNIYILLGLIILASAFAAMIEPSQDSYFFKKLKTKDEDNYIPLFMTAGQMGSFLSKIVMSVFLVVLSLQYVFLIMAILMFGFFLMSFKIKD